MILMDLRTKLTVCSRTTKPCDENSHAKDKQETVDITRSRLHRHFTRNNVISQFGIANQIYNSDKASNEHTENTSNHFHLSTIPIYYTIKSIRSRPTKCK